MAQPVTTAWIRAPISMETAVLSAHAARAAATRQWSAWFSGPLGIPRFVCSLPMSAKRGDPPRPRRRRAPWRVRPQFSRACPSTCRQVLHVRRQSDNVPQQSVAQLIRAMGGRQSVPKQPRQGRLGLVSVGAFSARSRREIPEALRLCVVGIVLGHVTLIGQTTGVRRSGGSAARSAEMTRSSSTNADGGWPTATRRSACRGSTAAKAP